MANNDKDKGKAALVIGAVGISTVALIAALTRKVKAAEPTKPIAIILDEEVRQALAVILSQQMDTISAINTTNQTLVQILGALGVEVVPERRLLEPFQQKNQVLEKGTPFSIYEDTGRGALIWAIFDVSDPDTKLSIRIDDLVWDFDFNTMLTQGIQQPLFPGAWLSKADAISGHYCIIFSAGTIAGFVYEQRLIISLTYEGAGDTANLHEARGIKWTYL